MELNRQVTVSITPNEPVGVRDRGVLESAQHAPAVHRHYAQTEDAFILAAILLCRIIANHPFLNANKRTAFASARNFLWLNGYEFDPPRDETIELCVGVATDDYDQEQVAYWISEHTQQKSARLLMQTDAGLGGSGVPNADKNKTESPR